MALWETLITTSGTFPVYLLKPWVNLYYYFQQERQTLPEMQTQQQLGLLWMYVCHRAYISLSPDYPPSNQLPIANQTVVFSKQKQASVQNHWLHCYTYTIPHHSFGVFVVTPQYNEQYIPQLMPQFFQLFAEMVETASPLLDPKKSPAIQQYHCIVQAYIGYFSDTMRCRILLAVNPFCILNCPATFKKWYI